MSTITVTSPTSHYGSFRDSLKAPIHRWFAYPAGFSHKLVEAKITQNHLTRHSTVADPFIGTGTTAIVAKTKGINSLGIEAHPFICWVAKTKLYFDFDLTRLTNIVQHVLQHASANIDQIDWKGLWPELVYKCFSEHNLRQLAALRGAILECDGNMPETDFLRLALTSTLRIVTCAGAGWPYIAPSKYQARTVERDAILAFQHRCALMISDIQYIQMLELPNSTHALINGDARKFASYAEPESIDLILTSPPYLNNYDYADRTRLETYFWGIHHTWGDITREVREHLILAATTQVRLSASNGVRQCPGIAALDREIHTELMSIIERLGEIRKTRSGRKTYDIVVAGYFEDMLQVIREAFSVLKPGGQFILVLGDSAPYGVYVPTDKLIGRIGIAVGFSYFVIEQLRTRGEKWGHNTQRHHVPLRESIVTMIR